MEVTVLAFGIAKDIMGARYVQVQVAEQASVQQLREVLERQFPELQQIASYAVAVNNEYAHAGDVVKVHDEIAIIPPVSGG